MSVALDITPVPKNIRKCETTRQNKKNEEKEQALRKRVNVKRNKKDPWVGSRKKMNKMRNRRKEGRRAKVQGAELPFDDVSAPATAAAHDDPVSDAAPTTPLIKGNSASSLRVGSVSPPVNISDYPKAIVATMSRLDLPSPPAPAETSKDLEPPTLETVKEVPETPGDFDIDYISQPLCSSHTKEPKVGRSHTNANNKKKLRRTKRGQKAQYKWAVSHTVSKKDSKLRRRNARRMKVELHHDGLGITGALHGSEVASSPLAQRERKQEKWVKKTIPQKGDCADSATDEKQPEEISGEAVPGRILKVVSETSPVEDKNAFDALARNNRRGRRNRYFRRNPRWRRNRKKKNKADQQSAPEPASEVANPPPDQTKAGKDGEAPAPKGPPKRRRNYYRKKNKQKPSQGVATGGKPEGDGAPAKQEAPEQQTGKNKNNGNSRRRNRNRNRNRKAKNGPVEGGQKSRASRNRRRYVWRAKNKGKAQNNVVHVPGPTAVDL